MERAMMMAGGPIERSRYSGVSKGSQPRHNTSLLPTQLVVMSL